MNSPTASGNLLIRRERDLRIDLARGLALLIIFVDHNAFLDHNVFGWLTAFTLGRYSFIDAADLFFFISGYVSGIIYTDVFLSQGLVPCLKKAFKRCLDLYLAEMTLFLFCSALILTAPIHDTSAPWSAPGNWYSLAECYSDSEGFVTRARDGVPVLNWSLLPLADSC